MVFKLWVLTLVIDHSLQIDSMKFLGRLSEYKLLLMNVLVLLIPGLRCFGLFTQALLD